MSSITTEVNGKCRKTNKVDFNASLTQCLRCCFFLLTQYTKEIIYFLLTSVEKATATRRKNLRSYIVTADFISIAQLDVPKKIFLFTVLRFRVFRRRSHFARPRKVMQKIFDELSITVGTNVPPPELVLCFYRVISKSMELGNYLIDVHERRQQSESNN